MVGGSGQVVRIGDWRVDPSIDEISREGRTLKLEPRTMRVLMCLAGQPGAVVSVEQLLDVVWKDVVVTQDSVYQAVAALRRALGDDPKHPAYIASAARKGYRLIAAVTPWVESAPVTAGTTLVVAERATGKRKWIVLAVLLMAAAGALWLMSARQADRGVAATLPLRERTVAVLPFVDMSEAQDQGYFADGVAEEVLDMLARIPQLKVIGRTSSFQFKGAGGTPSADLETIGSRLGAAYLVQGGVRRSGPRIRVTAQLIDVSSGTQLWAGRYDQEYDDILNVQDQIGASIARALQIVVLPDDARPSRPLRSTEAYTFYLRGRAALDRGDQSGLREAISNLEQAFALDPAFTRAAETLALAHLMALGNAVVMPEVGWPRAEAAARAALQLDPGSALAHGILGLRHATYDYDWSAAAQELDQALAANPRDPVALYTGSWLAFVLGRHEEAIRLSEASLSIDPLNPDACQNSAYIYYLVGNLEAAERDTRRSMAISPSFIGNRKLLGQILLLRDQPEAALVEMEAEVMPVRDLGLAFAYHALGRRTEADAALRSATSRLGELAPVDIATVHAFRGEHDQAFAWLEKAVAMRDLHLGHKFRDEPKLAPLRADPRYQALLRRMNLPG